MLNLTMKTGDDILLYDKATGKLMGVLTCSRSKGQTAMQFRMNDNIVVVRKALVLNLTENIEVCPDELLNSFGSK